ncbi:MAG: hypothetical protein M3Q56_10775 [Bacteroidota bacterium]|nr:hypothetical protein [Bacteroidota bacterium]
MHKVKIEKIASERSSPCVTISMNTHRTHPANVQDTIALKNLLKEAHERVIKEFGKRTASDLLDKMDQLERDMDLTHNLDSLHIFLSNGTKEIIKSPWPTPQNTVHIAESFAVKPLIKELNRTEQYLILVLSQSDVRLLHAINDAISEEVSNDDFPFSKNDTDLIAKDKLNDTQLLGSMHDYFNKIDKAVVKVHNISDMNCVVICTEDNYNQLLKVADKPSIYLSYVSINPHDTSNHTIASDAWQIINTFQKLRRADAITEMQEAVGKGNVITDLAEIFRAAKEGRGDLLISQNDFHQAVKMTGEYSFDFADDPTQPDVIDDITSDIAWQVISKKGRAIFMDQEEISSLGDIALKVRY